MKRLSLYGLVLLLCARRAGVTAGRGPERCGGRRAVSSSSTKRS